MAFTTLARLLRQQAIEKESLVKEQLGKPCQLPALSLSEEFFGSQLTMPVSMSVQHLLHLAFTFMIVLAHVNQTKEDKNKLSHSHCLEQRGSSHCLFL